jgi:ATP adenylyltransferase
MGDRIWAPWRMEYILGKREGSCVFCDMASAEPAALRKSLVLVVQEHALVCLNLYPFTTSHLLVAPKRHVADIADLPPDEYRAVFELIRESHVRLRAAVNAEAMNIGFNVGHVAGAGIADHVHGHLVPRWSGDTNFMPVLSDTRVMPEYLDDAWCRLYPSFADLPGTRAPAPDAP